MTIGIVGTGLIGGSFALAVKDLGYDVFGFDSSTAHIERAAQLGLVKPVDELATLNKLCDVIAVCVPVNVVVEVCGQLLDNGGDASIMELSSTKGVLAKALKDHPNRKRLVLTHPMAGTEFSGPDAAIQGLFVGKTSVLCDLNDSAPMHAQRVKKLYEDMEMNCIEQASEPHDLHVAYVSHISHISSFALSLTVLEKEKDESQIFNLASGGFSSTVRLAKSNPETWTPIFEHNRDHVLDVLDEYINVLAAFRTALIKKNFKKVHALMSRANEIGPMLPNPTL